MLPATRSFAVNSVKPTTKAFPTISAAARLAEWGGRIDGSLGLVDGGGSSAALPAGAAAAAPCEVVTFEAMPSPNNFVSAVLMAFAEHRPLRLSPDHFWFTVVRGVAAHVTENAEALRSRWVTHDGQVTLDVKRDDFQRPSDPSQRAAVVNDWAGVVLEFEEQVKARTVPGAAEMLTPTFSTTTPAARIANSAAALATLQKYFHYRCTTLCGFPQITLDGTAEDWVALEAGAERLVREKCLPELSEVWAPALSSVLSRISATVVAVDAANAKGEAPVIDVDFWQSFAKIGGNNGSGGGTWVNGWVNCFLPYCKAGNPNAYCVPYTPDRGYVKERGQQVFYDDSYGDAAEYERIRDAQSLTLQNIPSGVVELPVEWNYLGDSIPLRLTSGFVGVRQDPATLELSPEIGWFLTEHDRRQGK